MTSSRGAAVVLVLVAALSSSGRPEDAVPAYELPAGLAPLPLAPELDAAARRAVAAVRDPATPEAAEDAVRVLAGLGRGALAHAVRGLAGADWCGRAGLVAAVSEMDAPEATPLLVAACRDPAFAVREAAADGLGKTGDERGAAALVERASADLEPVWRVRVAAARALRRGVLRGKVARAAGEAALVRLLEDADEDVRRAALREVAPLAADAALPAVLAVFTDGEASSADRTLALSALRAYRDPKPALLDALRRGFLQGDDASEAVEAGRALLAMRGVAALEDEEISAAAVRRLHEQERDALREGLSRLGRAVAPWLRDRALETAARVAAGRENHGETSFDELLETLIQVDEAQGMALVKEILTGRDSGTLDRETRLFALRKAELVYAERLGGELRALYADARTDAELRPDILRVIVASGGDDLAATLDAALASPKSRLAAAAFELLDRRPDLSAGPRLLELAAGAADPNVRLAAIETLSRRDAAAASRLAAGLLDDPRAQMRSKAFAVLSASREPADFDRLVARLAKEDGADVPPPKPPGEERPAPDAGTTPSEHADRAAGARRRMVGPLLRAIRSTGGERARPTLLKAAESDPDAAVREAAAQGLRGIATDDDAAKLVALEGAEPDHDAKRVLLGTLATLGGSAEAAAHFDRLIADPRTRGDALAILAAPGAAVATQAMAAGLLEGGWTDDDRGHALAALERAGRPPAAAKLAALVADARTLDFCEQAAAALAAIPGPDATRALLDLAARTEDPERLASVVQALGARRAPEAEGPLLALFGRTRERALAARFSADPAVELYRQCAEAVAAFGSRPAGEALVEHLLDERLAHAAARLPAAAWDPSSSTESAPIVLLRTLVAAFARRDEEACRELLSARLDAFAATGRDLALPEPFAAGVAACLEDPLAFDLPARPRGRAALLLRRLVLRQAPRMSDLDVRSLQASDDQLGQERRYAEAADALREAVALADVEDAARPRERRLTERARIDARTAQSLAAKGAADAALELARKLRAPDPTDGELAYRQGWCLLRLGRADAEAKDALVFALAQDDKDARIHFQLAWLAERTGDGESARRGYDQAVALDRRRVEERRSFEQTDGHGGPHEAAAYPYWYARALRAAGDEEHAREWLIVAVSLDDRLAGDARADAAFAGWTALEAALAEGLRRIPERARRGSGSAGSARPDDM